MTTLILHLLSFAALAFALLFLLLAIANALLYIAELIEENAVASKSIGQKMVFSVMCLSVVLWVVDGMPLYLTLLTLVCHAVYLQNFGKNWPGIKPLSPVFLLSILLTILSHFIHFSFFADRANQARRYTYGAPTRVGGGVAPGRWQVPRTEEDKFVDVATYFGIFVWLVPFYLFVSLSANDFVLPDSTATNVQDNTVITKKGRTLVKFLFSFLSKTPKESRKGDKKLEGSEKDHPRHISIITNSSHTDNVIHSPYFEPSSAQAPSLSKRLPSATQLNPKSVQIDFSPKREVFTGQRTDAMDDFLYFQKDTRNDGRDSFKKDLTRDKSFQTLNDALYSKKEATGREPSYIAKEPSSAASHSSFYPPSLPQSPLNSPQSFSRHQSPMQSPFRSPPLTDYFDPKAQTSHVNFRVPSNPVPVRRTTTQPDPKQNHV